MGEISYSQSLDPRRHLALEGTRNIRDLGGYKTMDGRITNWKTMLRADNLEKLSIDGQKILVKYGVKTVIDLRETKEIMESPNPFSKSNEVKYTHQNLIGDIPQITSDTLDMSQTEGFDRYLGNIQSIIRSYCRYIDVRKGQFHETLATLATPGVLPALYHCNGCKDRTGLISALVLGLVGVPNETIAEDYAITGKYLLSRHIMGQAKIGNDVSNMPWEEYRDIACPPTIMQATLEYIQQTYGSVEKYVCKIGLSGKQIENIKKAMLV